MEILFIILFCFSSQLIHSVAVSQQNGFNPYPFGTPLICLLIHPLLLISSIFYLGWLWGIIIFLAHLFGILHATFTWILDVPALFLRTEHQFFLFERAKTNLLFPIWLGNLIFTVASFFLVEFRCLYRSLRGSPKFVVTFLIIVVVLGIVRVAIAHQAKKQ